MEKHNTAEIDELIAIQLIAYEDAASIQRQLFWLSFSVAIIGIFLIFLTHETTMLSFGFAAFLATIYSAWLTHKLGGIRAFAERVRKATLLCKGLGSKLSDHETRLIKTEFPGKITKVLSRVDQNYYASKADPGPKRLVAMLEQSAFWSQYLLKKSAVRSWFYFIGATLVTIFILLGFLYISKDQSSSAYLNLINVIMAGLTLLISRSFMGNALAYSGAERTVSRILERIQILKKTDDEKKILPDLLMILGDYNSAVESAPLFLPGLYNSNKILLEELWNNYS